MIGGIKIIRKILALFSLLFVFGGAYAAEDTFVATKGYVDTALSVNSTELATTIANAVQNINTTMQPISDKTTAITAISTDTQYPSAKAVYTMVQNDQRFDSLPATAPTGNPPAGRFFIWIEN